jgi:hypothetical protein
MGLPVLQIRIRDPLLFYPLDPGTGMNFFWIFFTMIKTEDFALETNTSKKK